MVRPGTVTGWIPRDEQAQLPKWFAPKYEKVVAAHRPDGSIYRLNWSLGAKRRPRESNEMLCEKERDATSWPADVELEPARF